MSPSIVYFQLIAAVGSAARPSRPSHLFPFLGSLNDYFVARERRWLWGLACVLCIFTHFYAFLCIFMHFYALRAFLSICMHIFMHFLHSIAHRAFLGICMRLFAFLCIFLNNLRIFFQTLYFLYPRNQKESPPN